MEPLPNIGKGRSLRLVNAGRAHADLKDLEPVHVTPAGVVLGGVLGGVLGVHVVVCADHAVVVVESVIAEVHGNGFCRFQGRGDGAGAVKGYGVDSVAHYGRDFFVNGERGPKRECRAEWR